MKPSAAKNITNNGGGGNRRSDSLSFLRCPSPPRRRREHFTFSYFDIWNDYLSKRRCLQRRRRRRRRRKTTTLLLWFTMIVMGCLQLFIMFHATSIHNNNTATTTTTTTTTASSFIKNEGGATSSTASTTTTSTSTSNLLKIKTEEKDDGRGAVTITTQKLPPPPPPPPQVEAESQVAPTRRQVVPPKLLLGIMGNANNHMGKIYRNRHRKLFQLWNDSRLCTYEQYRRSTTDTTSSQNYNDHDCRIVYAFIVGGYNSTQYNQPTLRVDEEPLTMSEMDGGNKMPRYKDIGNNTDVVILNIRENMNEGKTPTYLAWAYREARKLNIPYIAKCDSDAIFRWNSLLQFVYKELPTSIPVFPSTSITSSTTGTTAITTSSVLAGAWRHKAFWNVSNMHSNQFWNEEYYSGLHMYLAGQLYIVSQDLIPGLIEEAKKQQRYVVDSSDNTKSNNYYWEGHEDHDAISMIEISNPEKYIRWLNFPKHFRFWEHPVKGEYWWKRILQRETKKIKKARQQQQQQQQQQNTTTTTSAKSNGTTNSSSTTNNVTNRWEIPKSLLSFSSWSSSSPQATARTRSLLVILGASNQEKREHYRKQLLQQQPQLVSSSGVDGGSICRLEIDYNAAGGTATIANTTTSSSSNCKLYYIFAIGSNPKGPTEHIIEQGGKKSVFIPNTKTQVSGTQEAKQQQQQKESEVGDIMYLNIRDNIHKGIGQTVLHAINSITSKDHIDGMLLLCQADYIVNFTQWLQIENSIFATRPSSYYPHSIVLGDLRDKAQIPREFPMKNESFWYWEYENIHMYLGSELVGFSMSLLDGIVEQARIGIAGGTIPYTGDDHRQARNSNPRRWLEGNLGHDMSVFVYYIQKTIIHWIPIHKSQMFWYRIITSD